MALDTPSRSSLLDAPLGSLSVIIVGAGVGGLTAALALKKQGHHVTILEKSGFASEQGAAIQLPPNCSILLNSLDLQPESFKSDLLHHMIRFDKDGNVLFHGDLSSTRKNWIAEWYCVQRVDLHNALKTKVVAENITLHTSCKMVKMDVDEGRVELEDGRLFCGDVLLGADGVHSMIRDSICHDIKPKPTGLIALRWLMPTDKVAGVITNGPVDVIENPGSQLQWDDTDRRLLAYPCDGNKTYNMLAYLPSASMEEIDDKGWSNNWNNDGLVQGFSKFSPEVLKLVSEAGDSLRVFALYDFRPLPTWVSGRTALLGDAAHILQPFAGQGAAMAIEDAFSIATMLPLGTRPEDVHTRLELYQKARTSRTNMVREWAFRNRPGSVSIGSSGSWWFSPVVTQLSMWRLLAETSRFIQQTFGHDEREYSSRILRDAESQRPNSTCTDSGDTSSTGWWSSVFSFLIGGDHQ